MGLLTRLRNLPVGTDVPVGGADERQLVELGELLDRYEIVDARPDDGYIVVTERDAGVRELAHRPEVEEPEAGEAVAKGQISAKGFTRYRRAVRGDYNPELTGRRGIDKYREVRNLSSVRTTLRIAKTPVIAAKWFMQPYSQAPLDVEVSNAVWLNLTQLMSTSWPEFLIETLLMLDYGVTAFEKVFDIQVVDGQRRVVWKKFVPVPVYDIIEFDYEKNNVIIEGEEGQDEELPFWKSLIFTYDKEGGDLWGFPVLRSAYMHWFYIQNLYMIDAIQKERHGIGIPIIKLPPNYSDADKLVAGKIGENLRTNERAHVVLPPGWDVMFLKLEGQRVDALESAKHHHEMLYHNVLANFMLDGNEEGHKMFMQSARYTAEIVRGVLNKWAIPQLVDYNWAVEGYPQIKVRRLGDETDWRTLSFTLRNLAGANFVKPDDGTEDYLRDELDMPKRDPATARAIPTRTGGTPQAPQVGTPRQSPAGGQEEAQRVPNIGRAGVDRSGG